MSSYRTEPVALDGGSMDLHVWTPASGSGPAILLLQEIFGVGPYIKAVAERLAEAGYVVGAPDVFWRFAPGWAAEHDEQGLNDSIALMARFDFPAAVADCIAAMGALGALGEARGTPGVMGYCLGGTLAFALAVNAEPAACVSYYGSGVADMIGMLDKVSCPVLFHFGSEDGYIPNEKVEAISAAMAGRDRLTLNVEIAGHAFDNHEAVMFYNEAASKSAWAKTMAFLATHLPV